MNTTTNFANMNMRNFIRHICNYDDVDEILDNCINQSVSGLVFEKIFDVVIKFGMCDIFPNSDFEHMIGNSNTSTLRIMENYDEYLEGNVNCGKASGCSDITLRNKHSGEFMFISSKFPKTPIDERKQKSIEYYDVQNIVAMTVENEHIYTKYKIFLLVPDKKQVLKKVRRTNASSKYITKHMMEENMMDKEDLNKYFRLLKSKIMQITEDKWNNTFLSCKERLSERFHQRMLCGKTFDKILEGRKRFLWACKCRSGKTYMVGSLISKLKSVGNLNVLVITPAPTETMPQFTTELFHKFEEFDMFKIHVIKSSKNLRTIDVGDSNIFVMSKQLLQRHTKDETILVIKELGLDVIFFDENHFSGTTDISKDIISSYTSRNTVQVYLTATYNKPLREWAITPDCQMFWDIEDEQICKSILEDETNLIKLRQKHDDKYVSETLEYYNTLGMTIPDIFRCYEKMPDMHIFSNLFDEERYRIIKEHLGKGDNKLGFCFETLFSLNTAGTRFTFENEVKTMMRYISGSQKEEDGEKTIFTRINRFCSEKESRTPFTQLWFLPPNNIDKTSKCLKQVMKQDLVLKRYSIICINGKNKDIAKDVKDEISKREKKAKYKGKIGLIIIAGNMLSLGITLDLCDVVILMNNTLSSDKVFQQMFRCMTEADDKKIGIIVDLNIGRVLNTCINYNLNDNNKSVKDKMKYLITHHLINIDMDMLQNEETNVDELIGRLMEVWKGDPINNFKTLLRNLDTEYENFDNETQRLINKTFNKATKGENINIRVFMKEDAQDLPSGRDRKIVGREETKECVDNEDTEQEEKEDVTIIFRKDVLPYILPLTCILTVKEKNVDFIMMLNIIKENPELLEIFNEQCLIWWGSKDLIDLIRNIISENFDDTSNLYNIVIQIKMSLQSLIDSPKELLELIDECLKPKDIEKKENGEVFTPMTLVNEMLDELPIEVWTNKNLKWFDPASGMGNFPIAVYLRLMESLKYEFENQTERKRHILENMLYMSELNKKNVCVCKQIFDLNNEYSLNMYEGDTLTLVPREIFKVKKFDIILGNPPYNKGGIRSHTGKQLGEKNETIWTKFVEKSFEWLKHDGFLVFINPLSWLKKSHSLHDVLLEKKVLWLKLWDNSQSKMKIKADIPISLYVLKNTANIEKSKTKIISEMRRRNLNTVSEEYMDKKYSIPLACHSIFNKLIELIENNDLELEYKTKTVKSSGTKTRIHQEYGVEDMFAVDTYTIKDGIMVKKATTIHPDADKKKIIIANKSSFEGAFIDSGTLSLTGNHKFYILGSNLEILLKLLGTGIARMICHFTKYGQDFLDSDAFKYIPDIRKLGFEDIEENEFYDLLELTDIEKNICNSL